MNRTVGILPLTVALLGLVPRAGEGQQIPSPYRYIETGQEAGAFVGTLNPGAGRFEIGPRAGTQLGLRYAIEVGGPFSIEGVARTLSSTRDVRDPTKPEGERTVGEADVLLASVEARAKFSLTGRRTWHGVSPFAVAGGGVVWDTEGLSEVDERVLPRDRYEFGTSFLGYLGLGVRWIPLERVQLRIGGGFDLWQIDTPQGYLSPERDLGFESAPPQSEWVNGLEGSFGIAFRW